MTRRNTVAIVIAVVVAAMPACGGETEPPARLVGAPRKKLASRVVAGKKRELGADQQHLPLGPAEGIPAVVHAGGPHAGPLLAAGHEDEEKR